MELTDDSSLHNTESSKRGKNAAKRNSTSFDSERGRKIGALGNISKAELKEFKDSQMAELRAGMTRQNWAKGLLNAMQEGDKDKVDCYLSVGKFAGYSFDQNEGRVQNLNIKTEGKLDSTLSIQVGRVADERKG